jgi:myo-inositol 2-dehydrogenase / D-chiro-inositol 1-dehydrogenase
MASSFCHLSSVAGFCYLLFVFPILLSPMLNVALIGTGFIDSVHAANVARHSETNLAAIHDVDLSRVSQIAVQTGAKVVQDVKEIFAAKDIDLVFIASSTNTHIDYLRHAARWGKAVYCEKPIGLNYQHAKEVVEFVGKSGVSAMMKPRRSMPLDPH